VSTEHSVGTEDPMGTQDVLGTVGEAIRQLNICNSCRYCEGYCAVFPALERRTELSVIQANNARFHEALEEVAANTVLSGMVRSLRDRTAIIFARQSRARTRENWREHEAILRAVIAGDAELAGILATRHVHNAARMPELAEVSPAGEPAEASPRRKRAA